jgi:GNAT superfamily N-acetyltransferase
LLDEMERHYGLPAPPVAEIERDLARLPAGTELIVAVENERLLGLACFSVSYPAASLARFLYVKEVFVAASARRRGIGRRLMRALAKIAVARGCRRMDWTTARSNKIAQAMYQELGAELLDWKLCYRLEGGALEALAR